MKRCMLLQATNRWGAAANMATVRKSESPRNRRRQTRSRTIAAKRHSFSASPASF